MGTYIGNDDLAARYKAFDTKNAFNVSSDSIFYAEKEVESLLAPAFTVPFAAAHPTVKDLCIDMVYARFARTNNPKDGGKLHTALLERIQRIKDGVEPISTGSGTLDFTAGDGDSPESTTEDYHPVHSMLGSENEYTAVSSDRLSDLEDNRD